MKISLLRYALACLFLVPGAAALAQEFTLTDALSGEKMPLTMKPADIPADYRPMKLMGTGGGGLGDMFGMGSMFPLILAMGNSPMSQAENLLIQVWPITWTRGDVVRIIGQDYIVAYGMDLAPNSLKGIDAHKKLPAFNLKLKLIKTSEMGSITPLPEWSKERYLRAIAQIIEGPKQVAIRMTPPAIHTPRTEIPPTSIASDIITSAHTGGAIRHPAVVKVPTVVMGASATNKGKIHDPKASITETDIMSMTAPTMDTNLLPPPTAPITRTTEQAPTITDVQPNTTTAHHNTRASTTREIKPHIDNTQQNATPRPIDDALYKSALDNARCVAAAMLLYSQDFNGTLPYAQSTRTALFLITPYLKGIEPKTLNPIRGGEFRFNMCLGGVSMADIEHPDQTPVFYDPFMWPNGTFLVAFVDSHAMFLTATEWAQVKKNLTLKLKRNGTPLPANLGVPHPATNMPMPTPSSTGGGGS